MSNFKEYLEARFKKFQQLVVEKRQDGSIMYRNGPSSEFAEDIDTIFFKKNNDKWTFKGTLCLRIRGGGSRDIKGTIPSSENAIFDDMNKKEITKYIRSTIYPKFRKPEEI